MLRVSVKIRTERSDAEGGTLKDARGKNDSAASVVEGDGKGKDAPGDILFVGLGVVEQTSACAVDVGFAGKGDGLKDVAPIAHKGRHLIEDASAGEPVPGLT